MNNFKLKNVLVLLALIACLLSFIGCSNDTQDEPEQAPVVKNDIELNIMSFNIRYATKSDGDNFWDNRKELVLDVIKNNDPDVLGLQEALRSQLDDLINALPDYEEIGAGRDDGATKGEYAAILYKKDKFAVDESNTFWFSDTPDKPRSKGWGNKVTRICTWARLIDNENQIPFYIYNVHLDHQSQKSREKSVVLLSQKIRDRNHYDSFIVTGDFNAGEESPEILYLIGKTSIGNNVEGLFINPVYMQDSFGKMHPNTQNTGTFNGFEGKIDGERIDFIFSSYDNKIDDAAIDHTELDGRYPSDHFPVIAKMTIPKMTELEKKVRAYEAAQNRHDIEWIMSAFADDFRHENVTGITTSVTDGKDNLMMMAESADESKTQLIYINLETESDTVSCEAMEQGLAYTLMGINQMYYKATFQFRDGQIILERCDLAQVSIDAILDFQQKFALWAIRNNKINKALDLLNPDQGRETTRRAIELMKEYHRDNP